MSSRKPLFIIFFYLFLAKAKDTNHKEIGNKPEKQDKDNNNGDTDEEKHKEDERRYEPPSPADGDLVDLLGE